MTKNAQAYVLDTYLNSGEFTDVAGIYVYERNFFL